MLTFGRFWVCLLEAVIIANIFPLYSTALYTEDEDELVEIDVCLTGFSVVPLGHLPSKVHEL